MSPTADLYALLDVPSDADAATIKRRYRQLAKKMHPDTSPEPGAVERFKEITAAYEVLSDEAKRREYDTARRPRGQGGSRMSSPFNGLFDATDSVMWEPGAYVFGPRRGTDLDASISLDLAAAVKGGTVALSVTGPQRCDDCAGTGAREPDAVRTCEQCKGSGLAAAGGAGFSFARPCTACHGEGRLIDTPCGRCAGRGVRTGTRPLTVRLPAGVRHGARLRLRGLGAPGERGGPAGDLVVTVSVRPDPTFSRHGDDLAVNVSVPFEDLALGGTVEVPLLDGGTVKLKVAAGTAGGRCLRVRGRGVDRGDGSAGDLLVTVHAAVPAALTQAQEQALRAYARSRQEPVQ